MTCKEFEEVVHEFVRMELLDVKVRESILEHTAVCAHCTQRMAGAIALTEATNMAGESSRLEQAPAHLEAAVLAAFRKHHRKASRRRAVGWTVAATAAAVAFAFLLVRGGNLKQHPTPAQRKDITSQSGLPLDAKASGALSPAAATPAVAPVSKDASETAPYTASDFVPVPFAGAVTADDPGMIVRVQLTRASLAQLGYPVAETPGEDLIFADVLVGEDGWPRGVKVIQ